MNLPKRIPYVRMNRISLSLGPLKLVPIKSRRLTLIWP